LAGVGLRTGTTCQIRMALDLAAQREPRP
jgi:hypothetical protein